MSKNCPKCGAERRQQQAECFACGIIYAKYKEPRRPTPPDKTIKTNTPLSPDIDIKNRVPCPFCHEDIHKQAIKCKHCGETVACISASEKLNTEILGVIGLILPMGAAFFAFFWIPQLRLIDNPSEKLMLVIAGTILITALLFSVESSLLGMGNKNDKVGKSGPVTWFIWCTFMWIIGFPGYLYWRSKYGKKNLAVVGALISLSFLGAVGVINFSIESSKVKLSSSLIDLSNIPKAVLPVQEKPILDRELRPETTRGQTLRCEQSWAEVKSESASGCANTFDNYQLQAVCMENEKKGYDKMQGDFGLPKDLSRKAKIQCQEIFPMFQMQAVCMENEKKGFEKMQKY